MGTQIVYDVRHDADAQMNVWERGPRPFKRSKAPLLLGARSFRAFCGRAGCMNRHFAFKFTTADFI
jgi:hypothetical protein